MIFGRRVKKKRTYGDIGESTSSRSGHGCKKCELGESSSVHIENFSCTLVFSIYLLLKLRMEP